MRYPYTTSRANGAHRHPDCPDFTCLHFLALVDCLAAPVLSCDHLGVLSTFVQQHFLWEPLPPVCPTSA